MERRVTADAVVLVCAETGHEIERRSVEALSARPARRAGASGAARGRAESWERVAAWDAAIESTLLSGQYAGRPVYLDIEEPQLAAMARVLGIDPNEAESSLVDDVRAVLPLDRARWLSPVVERLEEWERDGADGAPPILAVLAVLVLAAERMQRDEDMAPHNYYGRLCRDVLELPERDRDRVATGFRKDAPRLFEALNAWLDREEGSRGLPTATGGSAKNRYVRYPISQALLRVGDRDRLVEMFVYYGLSAGTAVPLDDLTRLLIDYASRGGVRLGANLTRIVTSGGDSLARLAELVAAELESWDGTTRERGSAQDLADVADLRLSASLSGFPRRALRLALLTQSSDGARHWAAGEGSAAVVGGQEGPLRPLTEGWQLVEAPDQPVWSSVLTRAVRLRLGGDEVLRRPRRVVALGWDDAVSMWIEVERVAAGQEALLLVTREAAALVSGALEECARPGWRQDDELPGLPEGWTAFLAVQIMARPTSEHHDLAPLTAADRGSLTLGGGLRLPGEPRRWHRAAPPEARLSLATHERVLLSIRPLHGDEAQPGAQWSQPSDGVAVVPLDQAGLPSGDYVLRVSEPSSEESLLKATLRLRDGDRLAISRVGRTPRDLGHRPDGEAIGIGALPVVEEAALRGGAASEHLLEALAGRAEPDRDSAPPVSPPWVLARRMPAVPRLVETTPDAGPPTCFMTGAHHYQLPPAPRGRPTGRLVEGRCSHCGKRKSWPAWPSPKRQRAEDERARRQLRPRHRAMKRSGREVTSPKALLRLEERATVAPDLVLDALTHLRDGTAQDLDTVLRGGLDALGASQLLRDLEALGHIEVSRDESLRPDAWRVAPPALVVLPHQGGERHRTAVLVGARPPSLLEDLADAVGMVDLALEREEQSRLAPERITVHGTLDRIRYAATLLESRDRPVRLSNDAAWACARLMPAMPDVVDRLPVTRPPSRARFQRLDLGTVRWHDTPTMSDAGAYRVDLGYRAFQCLRTTRDVDLGVIRPAPQEVIKHAAAAALQREPLCAFQDGELSTPGLVGLPGLLERAAVLCSGRVAEERADGTRVYGDVPETIARQIYERLLPRSARAA